MLGLPRPSTRRWEAHAAATTCSRPVAAWQWPSASVASSASSGPHVGAASSASPRTASTVCPSARASASRRSTRATAASPGLRRSSASTADAAACTASSPSSTAPTIAASSSPRDTARAASSSARGPESSSENTEQLPPVASRLRLIRLVGMFGIVPMTPAAVSGSMKPSPCRQRAPKRATDGSTPMPTNTPTDPSGTDAESWVATESCSSCCGKVWRRSLGGMPTASGSRARRSAAGRGAWGSAIAASSASGESMPAPCTAAATMATRAGAGVSPSAGSEGSWVSTMRCALLPPNPNADTAARRTALAGQGSGAVGTRKPCLDSAAVGRSTCGVGGSSPSRIASHTLISPATPAAVIRWPTLALSEPSGRSRPASPNTSRSDSSSVASPIWVPVAWHST